MTAVDKTHLKCKHAHIVGKSYWRKVTSMHREKESERKRKRKKESERDLGLDSKSQ